MKKFILSISLAFVAVLNASAINDVIRISHGTINEYAALSLIDSIYFDAQGTTMYIQPIGETEALSLSCADITGVSYVASADAPTKIMVAYNGETASVDNPYFLNGVSAKISGAYVTITNTNVETEYTTQLSGSADDGNFSYKGSYKTTIVLNGVNITSQKGAAIDIDCGKRVAVEIKKGTENTLVDVAGGKQKAALYCKGHLEFDKAGTLNVTGNTKHAISAKEYIQLKKSSGIINILGAKGDGIHCNQYFSAKGFTVNLSNVEGDGIQAETQSLDEGEVYEEDYANGSIQIMDGTFNISLKSDGGIETLEDGTQDTYSYTCMQADSDFIVSGGTLNLTHSGKAGKCIKADGEFIVGAEGADGPTIIASTTGGKVTDPNSGNTGGGGRPGGPGGPGGWEESSDLSSSPKCIRVEGKITVYSGSITASTAGDGGEGLESKTSVLIKGGNHYFKCYDDCINSAGIVEFAGGNTVCYSMHNDAVDSNYGRKGAITISGGNVFAYTVAGSPEEGLDCDNNSYIVITGGIAISAGGNQGGGGGGRPGGGSSSSESVGSSTQGYFLGGSPSSYKASNYYTLYNTEGVAICTYMFEGSVSNSLSLLTAPNLGKGTITVKQGTAAPTEAESQVANIAGKPVFFIAPTVTTTGTTASVTAK